MTVDNWLNHIWYRPSPPPLWLRPLSLLYGRLAGLRRQLFLVGWKKITRLPCPVIVVGNLSVGGTGKTPLVLWLVHELRLRGRKPGIVTRGYGGNARQPQLVRATDTPDWVGDEAVLLARRSAVPVAIGRQRAAAAFSLVAAGCDVIVSDDGLQHYALARDCEIVVIDGERRFGNGRLLPAGPLREPESRLLQADAVVQNGGIAATGLLRMGFSGSEAVGLRDGNHQSLADFAGSPVHAIAGVGNPRRFFDLLRGCGLTVLEHPLADHARLGAADIRFDDDLAVLMTEKDAVKCEEFAGPRHWYVPVRAVFEPLDAERLMAMVERKIGRHG